MANEKKVAVIGLQVLGLVVLGALLGLGIQWRREYRRDVAHDRRQARWEYKVVSVGGEGKDRMGEGAAAFASVTPGEPELNTLGAEGWELVASYLEMETAWPNFGNEKYVAGLQPNVRPQRAVLVFRRRVL